MEIVPFSDDLIAPAAELVAARQSQLRVQISLLPDVYQEPQHAREAVSAAWERDAAAGYAAVEGDRLLGFLFGDVQEDSQRGRSLWVRLAGHSLAEGQSPELMRDLYQCAGADWVRLENCFNHYVLTFALGEHLDPWENLVFAREHAYALKALDAGNESSHELTEGVAIRRATADDAGAFRNFSTIISGTQSQSPSWVPVVPEQVERMRGGYAGVPADEDAIAWIAMLNDEPVSFIAYFPPEPDGFELFVPYNAIELKIAGTLSQAQSMGIGTALVEHSLRALQAEGHQVCMIDWHIPNLLSSRYWPKRGFEPVVYRMKRVIDSRISSMQIQAP